MNVNIPKVSVGFKVPKNAFKGLKIDEIRGVNSSQIVRRLLARGFIKICGKDDSIGKPNLYKTTNEFLDYFGLSSKKDLPEIINKNIEKDDNEDLYDSTYKENN